MNEFMKKINDTKMKIVKVFDDSGLPLEVSLMILENLSLSINNQLLSMKKTEGAESNGSN